MYTVLASIGFIWIFIVFFDTIFKTCMFHPYFRTLHTAGVDVKPFLILWRITRFNRYINRLGHYKPVFQKTWFNLGAIFTCAILLPCLSLYIVKLISVFQTTSPQELENSKLVAVIPGFNFPLSQWKLYGCVVLVCSIIHEAGHALAASRLGISVDSWGFAVLFIAPIAFVNLRHDQLKYCPRWQQMSIFCAGIWHNVVLSLSSLLLLKYYWLFVSPLFYVGGGVSVLQIHEQSSLNDVGGFSAGDVIFRIGNCTVKDLHSWNMCLQESNTKSEGLCVPKHLLLKDPSPNIINECVKKSDHLYFDLEIDQLKAGVCLQARTAVKSYSFCTQSSDCDESSFCVLPHLAEYQKFLVIFVHEKPHVLYAGSVNELLTDVKVTEFFPRFSYISSSIAETTKEFLEYILLFSNGLACLNVLPIFSLDGKFIFENLIHIFLCSYFSFEQRRWFVKCISTFCFGVVFSLFVATVYKMLIYSYLMNDVVK